MGKSRRKSAHIARRRRLLLAALVGLPYLLVRRDRAMPPGTHVRSMPCPLDPGGAKLLLDVTAYDASSGKRVIRHEIFDTALDMIRNAGKFVFLDMFLWNTWQSIDSPEYRPISTELADALMRKKTVDPDVSILILADVREIGAGVLSSTRGERRFSGLHQCRAASRLQSALLSAGAVVWAPAFKTAPGAMGAEAEDGEPTLSVRPGGHGAAGCVYAGTEGGSSQGADHR
jgi:hypothetical protein